MKKFLLVILSCTAIVTLQAAQQKKKAEEKAHTTSASASKTDSTTAAAATDEMKRYLDMLIAVANDQLLATAANGDLDGVKKALAEGANINYVAISDFTQFTALAYAGYKNHDKKVYNNRFYSWKGYPTFNP